MAEETSRVRVIVDRPACSPAGRADGWVVYWMTAQRRPAWNFALDRALVWSRKLGLPLVVLEPVSCSYTHAALRQHGFLVEGMADNQRAFRAAGVAYHPYVEPMSGAGRGLLQAWSERAAVVVADDHPGSLQSAWLARGAAHLGVRVEAVDGCGLLPLRSVDRAFPTAHSFRRVLQRELPDHLEHLPVAAPFTGDRIPGRELPSDLLVRWPMADLQDPNLLRGLPIDQAIGPASMRGGPNAGRVQLERFLEARLHRYGERGDPTDDGHSGLSPWLHFGHLSSFEVLAAVGDRFGWSPADLAPGDGRGARSGWWGLPAPAESFLDQLVTWRELAFNGATHLDGSTTYAGQPEWAQRTLAQHRLDPRPQRYALAELEAAATDDPLWNATMRELRREGTIHSYLRMLWGKRVLEWTTCGEEAFDVLVTLNDRYALDGRDPVSYASIGWVFGRYDRAWGPERPIYGKVRYMTSRNTIKKLDLERYLQRFGPTETGTLFA
ncbi:MAG: deoxyribodipyrimidine photolyase [Planctomycetota bacterium]|nr:deoxyribodipyrimidine photolyase [Planctomycetota bacterium]